MEEKMSKLHRSPLLVIVLMLVSLILAQCAPAATPTVSQPEVTQPPQEEATQPAAPQEEATEPAAPATEEVATEPSQETARASVFVFAHPTAFPDLDPARSFSNDSVVTSNCYETLTFYNPPGAPELLSPVLATEWEANEDATEWTFKLREGVTFQDGEPFNAEAVKYAIDKTMEIGVGAAYIWDPVEEIEVVDDYTVKFHLSYAAPLDLIASSGYGAWIYSPKAYDEHDSQWFNQGNCAGTGPYSIESYERGSRLVMTRYEDYWGGWEPGQFEKIIFEISQDPVVLQQKIESGTADFTYDIPPDNVENIRLTRDDIVVYTNPSFQNLVGLLNTKKPPLDNVLVRQALSYSFPYQQFIDAIMGERATKARGVVPAGMWGHGTDLFQYDYNLAKAEELLTEAGYADGGFDLLMTYSSGDLDEQQLGEVWKAELAKLGINLEVRGMNWEAQWDLAKSDPQNAQDVFVMYWWPDYVSPYSFLYSMFHSEEDILFNLDYYSNPDYDELIDSANQIAGTDREQAEQMFIQAQEILLDDAVSLFFYDVANTHLALASVDGYQDNPAYPHVVFVYQLKRK
jgi:peptide/nickel transport system substrate-binding protein